MPFGLFKLPAGSINSCASYQGSNSIVLILSVGARVFANWTNGLYYRGFVAQANSSTISIRCDDGDTITLFKNDSTAVILDILPCYSHITYERRRVIGFWPGRTQYYPGVVRGIRTAGRPLCYNEMTKYSVLFDDGDQRTLDFYQIRVIP